MGVSRLIRLVKFSRCGIAGRISTHGRIIYWVLNL